MKYSEIRKIKKEIIRSVSSTDRASQIRLLTIIQEYAARANPENSEVIILCAGREKRKLIEENH